MTLNPIDIRHQEFRKSLRGYDPLEVEQYLNMVADRMEQILHENEEFKGNIRELKARLESYTSIESAISETMVSARQTAVQGIDNARREAELMIKHAQSDGDKIIQQASEKAIKIRQVVHELEMKKSSLISEMRSILETHLRLLEDAQRRENLNPDPAKPKFEMTDSDVDRIASEFESEPGSDTSGS